MIDLASSSAATDVFMERALTFSITKSGVEELLNLGPWSDSTCGALGLFRVS